MTRLINLQKENPRYWAIRVENSRYSEAEINDTLAAIEEVNAKWQEFVDQVWDTVLTDEYGVMGGLDGYATDAHKAIAEALHSANGNISPMDNQNGQYEFPVQTWQKEIKATLRDMKVISKMVSAIK